MIQLFPRRHGASVDREFVNRCWAHRLLDRARGGDAVSADVIAWALRQTGDDDGSMGGPADEPRAYMPASWPPFRSGR